MNMKNIFLGLLSSLLLISLSTHAQQGTLIANGSGYVASNCSWSIVYSGPTGAPVGPGNPQYVQHETLSCGSGNIASRNTFNNGEYCHIHLINNDDYTMTGSSCSSFVIREQYTASVQVPSIPTGLVWQTSGCNSSSACPTHFLTWNSVSGATYYQYSSAEGGSTTTTGTTAPYYNYSPSPKVRACNTAGCSAYASPF